MIEKLLMCGLFLLLSSRKRKKKQVEIAKRNTMEETDMQKRKVQSIVEVLQKKVRESGNDGLHMKALGNMKSSAFALDSMGEGLKVKQLGDFVLEWSHFQKIIKKANGKYLTDSDVKFTQYYAITFILAFVLLIFINFYK